MLSYIFQGEDEMPKSKYNTAAMCYLDSVVEDLGSRVQRDILEGHDHGGLPATLGLVEFNLHHVVGKILSKLQRPDIWLWLELLWSCKTHF